MRAKSWIQLLIGLSFFACVSAFAQAGGSGGNGGDAVLQIGGLHGRFYVLKDLFDAKIYDPKDLLTQRQIRAFDQPAPEFEKLTSDLRPVMKSLPFSSDLQDAILYVLSRMDPTTARFWGAPLALYKWEFSEKEQFVDDYRDPEDYRTDIYKTREEDWAYRYGVHQAARRIGETIYISTRVWNFMDKFNKVGLIFHEIIYSLLKADPKLTYGQKPEDVRDAVAALFKILMESETEIYHFQNTVNFYDYLAYGPSSGVRLNRAEKSYEVLLKDSHSVTYRFVPLVTPKFETRYLAPTFK